jgi:serine/threonine protein phosphatase PrpC
MRFSIFQESAIGARRSNQDRMGYCFTRDSLLMVLADGMGGHPRGDVAASLAVQAAGAAFQQRAPARLESPSVFLRSALLAGHRDILRYQALHGLPESPRTTVVACVVQQGRAWWAHAGDSRLYWLRDGRVLARTRDHSLVEALLSQGALAPESAATHAQRHQVSSCLGGPREPRIDVAEAVDLRAGDTLLLCSDGVWSAVPEEALCALVRRGPVDAVVPELLRLAVAASGPQADNATALAMTWEGESAPFPAWTAASPERLEVTTTIALEDAADAPPEDVSDEEIERAIREIREAIQRNKPR